MPKQTWDEFSKRYFMGRSWGSWFCCVDEDGCWYDSALSLEVALEYLGYQGGLETHSIVHSSTLRKMFEAGLVH